ncbi:MAG: peptide deformylase [Acidimicrobiales bacterium]
MARYPLRMYGDPVLRQHATEVADIDGRLAQLAADMLETMHAAEGAGLAAPQIGVQRRLFVYQIGDAEPRTIVNPVVVETRGEWEHEEGCLSIPDQYFDIVRPKEIHLIGWDLDGNDVSIEADELEARCLQHEIDHLDGRLLLELLDDGQRKKALRELRRRAERADRGRR